jgi:hypothetical protein
MGIVFSSGFRKRSKKWLDCLLLSCVRDLILIFLASIFNLSRELLGEALLLGPLVVVGGGVLFEDLGVFGDEVLAAEGADGHGLRGLDRGAVLVHLHAGAGGVGLLVLAGDAVLLGDRHVGGCVCGCGCGGGVCV